MPGKSFYIEDESSSFFQDDLGSSICMRHPDFAQTSGKYQLIDQSPNEGINYYRIKEVDEDGGFTFSKVVDIYDRATAAVSIYPSPATNKVHVLLPLKTKSINLYDALGNKIAHYNVTTQSTIDVDVSHFARGGYYLEVVGDSNKVIRHFEKL